MTTATRQPPTTAWGALLIAAALLEDSRGLARVDTLEADYKAGKHDPYSALQEALWPSEEIPRIAGGIPRDRDTGRPYWTAVAMLDTALGGTGELMTCTQLIDKLLQDPKSTRLIVAEHMRRAARRT